MQQLIENYKRLLRLTYKALIPFTGHQYLLMLERKVEVRPVWKPMHKQPVYAHAPAYLNGVSEAIFKVGMCLPAGPMVTDDDARYIVDCIKDAIE